ncbi:MAG: hypothetical protein Ct9H90mP21_2270 [Methanobacteriota archaeon]|nr:MAG: hypothetical protein Ct9H90mP21_2270 [Euryarchaeota archaeon]
MTTTRPQSPNAPKPRDQRPETTRPDDHDDHHDEEEVLMGMFNMSDADGNQLLNMSELEVFMGLLEEVTSTMTRMKIRRAPWHGWLRHHSHRGRGRLRLRTTHGC